MTSVQADHGLESVADEPSSPAAVQRFRDSFEAGLRPSGPRSDHGAAQRQVKATRAAGDSPGAPSGGRALRVSLLTAILFAALVAPV